MNMQYRPLGNSGISASVVGLGAWLLRLYLAHARHVAANAPQIPPHTAALAALQALLEQPGLVSLIVGAKRPAQIDELLQAIEAV